MMDLAGLHHIVRYMFYKNKINFKMIPPTVLKKFVTGKGNCKKELILLYVFKKWGITIEDNNIADAYSLSKLNLYENR
jgi:crossover junction endodeoxyribonuclease RuvC